MLKYNKKVNSLRRHSRLHILLSKENNLLLYLHQQYCQFMMYLCKQDLKMKSGLPPLPLGEGRGEGSSTGVMLLLVKELENTFSPSN